MKFALSVPGPNPWTKSVDQIEEIWSASEKSNRMTKFWRSNVAQISGVADEK
jgi:hypothetical protein